MGKWVHRLTDIDAERRTATCAHCGPVRLKPYYRNGAITGWRCKTAWRRGDSGDNKRDRANRQHRHLKKSSCERCGFVPEHPIQLDVHHVDGNRHHNDPGNLQTLCANCHRLLSL
jgi:hypothetical protein